MEAPELDRMWETWIRIPIEAIVNHEMRACYARYLCLLYDIIRFKIYPMVAHLKENGIIDWYSFLIHEREGDPNLYFHVRFNLRKDVKDKEGVNKFLPNYCEKDKTARCKDVENIENIKGINKSILKNNEIEEAWRILGEQSEWLINMLNIHKENVVIPATQVGQFLHFYFNMAELQFECPHCQKAFHSGDVIIVT